MTEWFAAVGNIERSNKFREEDNHKVDRLEVLFQAFGLPYERPDILPARALTDCTPEFGQILETRGDELCAIRLVPSRADLPKIRERGLSIRHCYENWFKAQTINPDDYTAYICPHTNELLWSLILVVTEKGVVGEIVRGSHAQLTHGDTKEKLFQFSFDWRKWHWSDLDAEVAREVQRFVGMLRVTDLALQANLKSELSAEFFHGYLGGYFEATVWPSGQMYAIDYNRLLPELMAGKAPTVTPSERSAADLIVGACAQPGVARGPIRLVTPENLETVVFDPGDILVCDNTDVRFVSLMKRAGAIVTNRGGILSHAAIVARELGKPCVIGTKIATQVLLAGQMVEVDAAAGLVRLI